MYGNLPGTVATRKGTKKAIEAGSKAPEIEIPYSELTTTRLIGSGAFGDVYAGQWRHIDVAIKKLRSKVITDSQLKEFLDEAILMKNLRPHGNLIKIEVEII